MTSTPAPGTAPIVEPYSIKRGSANLMNCDAEPVHTPGCIRSHGVLLVLRRSDLCVLQVSENSADHLGKAPGELLGRRVSDVVGDERAAFLARFVAEESLKKNPLYAFTLPDAPEAGIHGPLDALVHASDGGIILELERTGRSLGEPDYYGLVKGTVARLQAVTTLREFYETITADVRALTGLDRVMIYRFHEDHSGEVVGEAKRADLPPFLGLHYPADDIPRPAREIFTRIWIRPVPDAAAPLAEMMPLENPDTGRPVEMTYCALRGASVMYTEYLANMGVAASLTMALHREGKLWGLVACHHETPIAMPYQVRAACELLAQVATLQIVAVEQREHQERRARTSEAARRIIDHATHEDGLATVVDDAPSLLDALLSDGVAIFHRGRWHVAGRTPTDAQIDALALWLRNRPGLDRPPYVYATDHLGREYPPGEQLTQTASGLLAAPFAREGRHFVLWFRGEVLRTVRWAGDPREKPVLLGPHGPRLTPRKSFEIWREQVRGTSAPWGPADVEAAAHLRVSLMELVANRAERLALLNAELSRSNAELDAFAYVASHDLKEPLRGIHNYASHLAEHLAGALDDEAKQHLDGVLRLTLRMDGLLDALLLFSRVGRTSLTRERVDLPRIVAEALEMLSARQEETRAEVRVPRPLPAVSGEPTRIREIFANLISNALKYNDKPARWVEIGWLDARSDEPITFYVRDNGIGIKERHLGAIFVMFERLHGRDAFGGGAGAGLTIVKKCAEAHGGKIWVESAPGEGSTFFFTLEPGVTG